MKRHYFLLALMLMTLNSAAQNMKMVDSLSRIVESCSVDTTKVLLLNRLSQEYMDSSPQKCDSFAGEALRLASEIKYVRGIGRSYYLMGANLLLQGGYNEALQNFYRSEEAYLKINDSKGLASVYGKIGNVFWYNKNYDKAIEHQKRALRLQKKINDKVGLASTYNNLGVIYNDKGDFDEAIANFSESAKIKIELNDERALAVAYNNIAGIYAEQGNNEEALAYCIKALKIYEKNNDVVRIAFMNVNVGEIYTRLKNYNTALQYYDAGLQFSITANSIISTRDAYRGKSVIYDSIGDYKNAYKNRLKYEYLNDSIYNVKQSEQFAEMQTKYETTDKERKIVLLEKEGELKEARMQQTITVIVGVSGFVILLIVLIVSFVSIKRQKKTRREMIRRIIETEEKERGHFAEELHDGLGPLLSSINMYVDVISNEKTEAQKKTKLITDVGVLIQDAISSTKVIANNLTPVTLKDFGVGQAIEAFCRKANSSEALKIHINDATNRKHYHTIIETTVYRVALEMINNTFKYAEAKLIHINLVERNNILYFDYSDDGKGFDLEKVLNSPDKGQGLSNMLNRTHSINGHCELKSSPGAGFSASISIPLKYLKNPE